MADAQVKAMAIIFAIAAVSAAFIGAGYAFDYYGTTTSHSQDIDVKYVVVEVNGNTSGSLINTFHFLGPAYYTDTSVPGSTTYRTVDHNETSQAVQIRVTGANTTSVTMSVKLANSLPSGATAKIQFYNADQSQTVGPETTITTTDTNVTALTVGTIYYCKVTLSIAGQTTFNPTSSDIDLDVTFTASAQTP